MELLAPTVTALQTLLEVCTHMLDLMTLYTTQRKQYAGRPKQSQGRFSIRVRLGNENLSIVKKFHYLGHIMTADCTDDKDIKK